MVTDMIKNILVVGAGSFLGGAVRYLVSLAMKGVGKGFPWATLAVGLCGGFTTFSTFSKEALIMLQAGNVWGFAGYVAISVAAGIALVALGCFLVH